MEHITKNVLRRRKNGRVKLSRLEKKLEALEIDKTKNKATKCSSVVCLKQNQANKEKDKKVEAELNNLFVIKDKSVTYYRLKKENMRFLVREQKKNNLDIQKKKTRIHDLNRLYQELPQKYQLRTINQQISQLEQQKRAVIHNISSMSPQQISSISQVKKI